MKIPAKFKEYIWLVNTIRKARRITFAEINEKWLNVKYINRLSNYGIHIQISKASSDG